MKRRLTQLGFALGLLLTLGAGTLWVRGWWTSDVFVADRWVAGAARGLESISFQTDRHTFWLHWSRRFDRTPGGGDPGDTTTTWEFLHERGEPVPYTFVHDGSVRSEWEAAPQSVWGRLGFEAVYESGAATSDRHETISYGDVSLPAWLVVSLSAALTYTTGRALHRARRDRARLAGGSCVGCGYDLRGAPHERCPECGGTVAAQAV